MRQQRRELRQFEQQPAGAERGQGHRGRRLGQLPGGRAAGRDLRARRCRRKGVKVTPKFNIGAREVYYPQIEKGAITIIPEYNGALLTTSVDTTSTAATTAQVDAALKAKLPVDAGDPQPVLGPGQGLGHGDPGCATKHHLTSIAQLKPIAKNMVIGGPPEFKTRSDGLVGLKKNYGLMFKGFDPLDESGPDHAGRPKDGKVQAADVFTTTPQIITDHLVSLADPKFNFAAQNVRPAGLQAGRQRHGRQHAERDLGQADHDRPAGHGQGGHPRPRPLRGGRRGLAQGRRLGLEAGPSRYLAGEGGPRLCGKGDPGNDCSRSGKGIGWVASGCGWGVG